jgi:hypothetical protein
MLKCSNRQTFKSCKMLLLEKEEQSLESKCPSHSAGGYDKK